MTSREIKNLGIDMSILMDPILDINATPEEVANTAISFAKQIFSQYPKIKQMTEDVISSYDENDPNFSNAWDKNIEWINNWSK